MLKFGNIFFQVLKKKNNFGNNNCLFFNKIYLYIEVFPGFTAILENNIHINNNVGAQLSKYVRFNN